MFRVLCSVYCLHFYRSCWCKFAVGNQEFWWPEQFVGVFFSCEATVPSVSHWHNFRKQGIKQLCLQICGMRCLWQCVLRLTFSSMWCGVVCWIGTNVSEGSPASIFRVEVVKMVTAGCSEILNPIYWSMWLTSEKAINILVFICYINFFILHLVHIC